MTAVDNLTAALEHVESHLHPQGSFKPSDHAVPTGLEEIWRFTPLKRLRGLHDDGPFGQWNLETAVDLADGVRITRVHTDQAVRGRSGYVPVDRVSARAWAETKGVQTITIDPEKRALDPSYIVVTGHDYTRAVANHLVIRAGRFSKAIIVLEYSGSTTLAENIEVIVEDGADLTLVTVHDWARTTVHVVNQHARVGRDATFKHVTATFGGDVVRASTSVDYAGPGGSAELYGVYFADEGQHIEHRLFADHTAPKTRSNVLYKGALQGQDAHTVWIGNVLIRKVAEGIQTFEQNDNLVLTDGARADSVPNLEIETGEIEGAGHASTTGRFDDNQLFYLQSRGIDATEAKRLVVHGFFVDLVRRIGVAELQDRLIRKIEGELDSAERSGTDSATVTS